MTAKRKWWDALWFVGMPEFNPSYVFLGIGVVVLSVVTIMAFALKLSPETQIASLSSLTVTINILTMAAVSQNKAQIIAGATSSGQIAKGLSDLHPFGGSTEAHDDGSPLPLP